MFFTAEQMSLVLAFVSASSRHARETQACGVRFVGLVR